jgi:hypothetical protein
MTLTVRAVQGYALARPVSGATIRAIQAYALVDPNPLVPGPPAPTDYKADQIDILYDLIEKSNPGFKAQYPKGTVSFGTPANATVIKTDPYKTDTSILVYPAPGSTTLGQQTIRYRRIDLNVILRNMTLTLNDYFATTQLPVATWKASFVKKYGLNIPASDMSYGVALNSGVTVSVPIIAGSLCYKGTLSLTWTQGPRTMADLITDANRALVGRSYPAGNNFAGGVKQLGEFLTYAQDFSAVAASLNTVPATWTAPAGQNTAAFLEVIAELNRLCPDVAWSNAVHTVQGGTTSLLWYRYALPNAAVPEANSDKFTSLVMIPAQPDSWWRGNLYLHYGKRS